MRSRAVALTTGTASEEWLRTINTSGSQKRSMATILVVDDEPVVRDVVVRYLRRDGFATLEAENGDDARELIRTLPAALTDG
jgi:response regulator RpfG family c-di-GMP phosphodiesterase